MSVRPEVHDVEIKVNVAAEHGRRAARDLGLDVADAKRRRIWFFEHTGGIGGREALPLFHGAVILRARCKADGEGDITVKLRAPELSLPEAWSQPAEGDDWKYKIEGDWTGERHSVAASLGVDGDDLLDGADVPDLDRLTARQIAFLHSSLDLPIDVSVLEGLGPIDAETWSPTDVGFDEQVAAERWRTGSLDFLELSLRVDVGRAAAIQAEFDHFLADRGVSTSNLATTKTEIALSHLAGRH